MGGGGAAARMWIGNWPRGGGRNRIGGLLFNSFLFFCSAQLCVNHSFFLAQAVTVSTESEKEEISPQNTPTTLCFYLREPGFFSS